jgi:hypothetical protein
MNDFLTVTLSIVAIFAGTFILVYALMHVLGSGKLKFILKTK